MTAVTKRVMFVPDGGGQPMTGTLVELPPLSIWPNPPEGQAPLPSHPIALPGDPWWGQDLHPEHPIVIPPPGEVPPESPPGTGKLDCRWGYTEAKGWQLFCVYDPQGGGKPRPPTPPAR